MHPVTQIYQFDMVTHTGRVLFLSGQPRPQPQGDGVPALPNFLGSLPFMHTRFVAELPNLTW